MNTSGIILVVLVFFITLGFINKLNNMYLQVKIRRNSLDKLPEILAILEKAKMLAFEKVWREDLLVYTESNTSINAKDLNNPMKKYLKLVLDMIGKNIKNDLIILYGEEENIILNLSLEFVSNVAEKDILLKSRHILDASGADVSNKELQNQYKLLVDKLGIDNTKEM